MKIKVNDTEYQIVESGYSCFGGKLYLSIIKGDNSIDDIKDSLDGNSGITVLDSRNKVEQKFFGYTEIYNTQIKENFVITAETYDDDGELLEPAQTATIVVITLKNEGYTPQEQEETAPTIEELAAQIDELSSRLDYLFMTLGI